MIEEIDFEDRDGSISRPKFKYEELYIAFENRNLDWMQNQILEFIRLWEEEYQLEQIARFFKRNEIETFILYLDLVDQRKIKPRMELRYEC